MLGVRVCKECIKRRGYEKAKFFTQTFKGRFFELLDEHETYQEMRGAEHIQIHRAKLQAKAEGREVLNKVQGISDRNKNGTKYIRAAVDKMKE